MLSAPLVQPAPVRNLDLLPQSASAAPARPAFELKNFTAANPVPTVGRPVVNGTAQPNPAPEPQSAVFDKLFLAESYRQAGDEGLALLARGVALTQEQRWRLGSALSWSGRGEAARAQFQSLLFTPFDAAARLGMANTHRWEGRPELAAPVYQQVLAQAPGNPVAAQGLRFASRALRPSSTLGVTRATDNQGLVFDQLNAMHRWRNETGQRLMAIEAQGIAATTDTAPQPRPQQRSLGVRYEALDLRFAPRLQLEVQTQPDTRLLGGVRLQLGKPATHVHVGHLNWGALNYSALSLANRYTANRLGLEHLASFKLGDLSAQANYYTVSDSNTVLTSQLKFTPAWRPLGQGFKTFVVSDTRNARFNTSDYWSPATGAGLASVGVSQDWETQDWSLLASAQTGRGVYGDAGTAWSATLAGKRWLSPDYALGFNATLISTQRDEAAYRASFVNVNLEKLW